MPDRNTGEWIDAIAEAVATRKVGLDSRTWVALFAAAVAVAGLVGGVSLFAFKTNTDAERDHASMQMQNWKLIESHTDMPTHREQRLINTQMMEQLKKIELQTRRRGRR